LPGQAPGRKGFKDAFTTGNRIEFEVTYFLHFQDGDPKIFAYITGDEERVLREHGLS
jgi:hypothetical protein